MFWYINVCLSLILYTNWWNKYASYKLQAGTVSGYLKNKIACTTPLFSFEKKESLKYRPQRVRNQPLSFRNSFNNQPFEKVAALLEINQAENCPVSNKESPQFKNK